MAIQRPNAVGIFLCGMVTLDEKTHNVTLANTFHNIGFNTFPSPPAPIEVYSELTDGLGEVSMKLIVTRCATLAEIYTRSRMLTFHDPLLRKGLHWKIRTCSFPGPGRYEFALIADGEPLTQTILHVVTKEVQHG